ncbi:hypothetical protein [Streptodolium elevatio]|uniref:Uncharacterized protein n=1 Tax=Streptodolium elevatio TaxID=3157996 RepID=A0ABV3DBY4_9ACTN
MSRDGRLRFDLRVTHRMGLGELASVLASAFRYHDTDEGMPDLSRAKVLAAVREELYYRGSGGLEGWGDDLTEVEAKAMRDWATGQVGRAFPELVAASDA